MLNEVSSNNSEESSYEEDDINQVLTTSESDDSDEEDKDYCLEAELCTCDKCIRGINMITSDQATTLITILKEMPESSQKEEFMLQIKNMIDREEKKKNTVQKIEFKEIMNRFKPIVTPPITIKDLQNEISLMKQEIDLLKVKDLELEFKYLELKGKQIVTARFSRARKVNIYFFFSTNTQSAHRIFFNEPAFKYTKELITIRCFDKQSVFLNSYNPSLSIQSTYKTS
jgi:hypothetical protein